MSKDKMTKIASVIIFLVFVLTMSYVDITQSTSFQYEKPDTEWQSLAPPSNTSCYVCHTNLSYLLKGKISKPAVEWQKSVHFSSKSVVMCTGCHGGNSSTFIIADSKLNTTNYIRNITGEEVIKICGRCHKTESDDFQRSDHWLHETNNTRLSCSDCHGKHDIQSSERSASPIYRENIPQTCGKCHEEEFKNYYLTFHGKNLNLGNNDVAVCTDCHSSHNILSHSDEESSTSTENLASMCAKCHDNDLDVIVTNGIYHDSETIHTPNLIFDKSEIEDKHGTYFIGPVDLGFYIPFIYSILIALFVFTLISLIIFEVLFSKLFNRD
jgi:hypothetical protein